MEHNKANRIGNDVNVKEIMTMKHLFAGLMVVMLSSLSISPLCAAPIVQVIPYTKSGIALPAGAYMLKFSLWTDMTAGTSVWFEEKQISLTGNTFTTKLGDTSTLSSVDFSMQLWVKVERKNMDGTYAELPPKDILNVAPYALYSEKAGTVPGYITGVLPGSGLSGGGTEGDVIMHLDTVHTDSLYVNEGQPYAVTSTMISAGAVGSAQLGTTAVTTEKIADGQVTGLKILDGTIDTVDLKDNAVTSFKIKNSDILNEDLGDGAVTSAKIADGGVDTPDIKDDAVTSAKIKNLEIKDVDIADSAVTSAKIADGGVDTPDIKDDAVTSVKIKNLEIKDVDIADGAITGSKIKNGDVGTVDIAENAITSAKIANGTIKAEDMEDGAVTSYKLKSDSTADANRAVGTNHVRNEAISNSKLALHAVTASKLAYTYGVRVQCNGDCSDSNLGHICDSYYTGSYPISVSCRDVKDSDIGFDCGGNNKCSPIRLSRSYKLSYYCDNVSGWDAIVHCMKP